LCIARLARPGGRVANHRLPAGTGARTMHVHSLDSLPEELLSLLLSAFGHTELCRFGCTSVRLRDTVLCDARWEVLLRRWSVPPPNPAASPPGGGWRAEFIRRYRQDARVIPLLFGLSEQATSSAAWHELLAMGDDVYERVIEVVDATQESKQTPHEQAWSALRALNQQAVRRQWARQRELAARGSGEVPVENGSLLLVWHLMCGTNV